MSAPASPWMTPKDAAEYSGRHVVTIRTALASKELAGVQRTEPKGHWRTTKEAVDRWIMGLPAEKIRP